MGHNNRGGMGGGQMQQGNMGGGGYMQQNQQMGYQPNIGMQQNMGGMQGGMQMNNNMGMSQQNMNPMPQQNTFQQQQQQQPVGGGGYQPYSGGMSNQSSFTVANPGYSPQRGTMGGGGQIGNTQSQQGGGNRPAQRRAWI